MAHLSKCALPRWLVIVYTFTRAGKTHIINKYSKSVQFLSLEMDLTWMSQILDMSLGGRVAVSRAYIPQMDRHNRY